MPGDNQMLNSIAYNIPASLVEAYRGRKMIVRAQESSELVAALSERDFDNLLYVRLLSLNADVDALANWGFGAPVDITLSEPAAEFPKLYRHAKLLDKHPVRVSMPVTPGFSQAARVAAALNFAVRLEPAQPAPEVMAELFDVLDFFLHHPSVTRPMEYFHSALLAFYDQQSVTLWAIQEEDPAVVRYVTDDGVEIVSPRFAGAPPPGDIASFLDEFQRALLAERGQCYGCEFFENCGGYFKWPRRDYDCAGVKIVFRTLKEAAGELKRDLKLLANLKRYGT
jgi:hypothetical protein